MKFTSMVHSLKFKTTFLFMALLIITAVSIAFVGYKVAREELNGKGQTQLKNAVKMALVLIEENNQQVMADQVSLETAQENVKETLIGPMQTDGTRLLETPIELGDNGYFIAYSQDGYEVMHPRLEGDYVWDVTSLHDPDFYLVQEQIAVASQGGFMTYDWYYPNSQTIGKKLSYSEIDPHWGWVVVASAYESDFNAGAYRILKITLLLTLLILALTGWLASRLVTEITSPIIQVRDAMVEASQNNFSRRLAHHHDNELGDLVKGFNTMNEALFTNEQRLHQLAYYDPITGLMNSIKLETLFNHEPAAYRNHTFVLFDLPSYKLLVTAYGKAFGKQCLQITGQVLKQEKTRANILPANISNNEFAFFFPDPSELKVKDYCQQLQDKLYQQFAAESIDLTLTINFSTVSLVDDITTYKELIQKANIALQTGIRSHQDFTVFSDRMKKAMDQESSLRSLVSYGLQNKEFYMAYQAKVDPHTDRAIGVEALARWQSSELGLVSPGQFIPVLDRWQLMMDFSEYVLDSVFKDYPGLQEKYGPDIDVSINISPEYIMKEKAVDTILSKASHHRVPHSHIIIEITEDILLYDLNFANQQFHRLQKAGIRISLDDFGTGYASLSYLNSIQLDEIKIDKSFIDTIHKSAASQTFFKTMVNLLDVFPAQIVVEGVESEDQVTIIKETKCHYIQGYYYSKPQPLSPL